MEKKVKLCRECRDGETEAEATHTVIGVRTLDNGRKVPYRGAVCDLHLESICDNTELTTIERVNANAS